MVHRTFAGRFGGMKTNPQFFVIGGFFKTPGTEKYFGQAVTMRPAGSF